MRRLVCSIIMLSLAFYVKYSSGKALSEGRTSVTVDVLSESNRGSKMAGMPEQMEVQVSVAKEKQVILRLKKNVHVNLDVPITFENPETTVPVTNIENVEFYHDVEQEAAVSMTRSFSKDGIFFSMEGFFKIGDLLFQIQPDITSEQTERGYKHEVKRAIVPDNEIKLNMVDYDTILTETRGTSKEDMRENDTKPKGGPASFHSYNIEMKFVLDHTIWQHWLELTGNNTIALRSIKLYYLHQINHIDMTYSSLNARHDELEIAVWLRGFHVAETAEDSSWTTSSVMPGTDNAVYGTAVAQKLGRWSTSSGRTWFNMDHTMLWTRYDLFNNSVAGYTNLAGICVPGRSVSVIEDLGVGSFLLASHVLAHSLGAYHDGVNNDCDPSESHIMGSNSQHLTFSSCSKHSFNQLLEGSTDGYPRVCLTNRVCDHDTAPLEDVEVEYDMTHPPSLDDQCRHSYGPDSYFCGDSKEEVCRELFCSRDYNGEKACVGSSPGVMEYTLCSMDKWCRRRSCVSILENPAIPVTADFLDESCIATGLSSDVPGGCEDEPSWTAGVNGHVYVTCLHMIITRPQLCFTSDLVKTGCCATCHMYGAVSPSQHATILHEADEDPCPAGSYKRGMDCMLCPAGTFRLNTGGVQVVSCTLCASGHVSTEGSTRCTVCPPGEYSAHPGDSQCQKCSPGTHQGDPGSTGCDECKKGEYQNEAGSTSCKICPSYMTRAGSTDCSETCPPGEYKKNDTCVSCPPGSFQANGYSLCTPCASGSYQPRQGAVTCDLCMRGQYQVRIGQISCKDCPATWTTVSEGSKSPTECNVEVCENIRSEKTCTSYSRKKKCQSDKNRRRNRDQTWAEYMKINCRKTCKLC